MIWANTNKRKVQIGLSFSLGKEEKRPLLLGLIYQTGAHTAQHVFLWVSLGTTCSSQVGRCRFPQTQVGVQRCQLDKFVTRSGDLNCQKQKATNLVTFFWPFWTVSAPTPVHFSDKVKARPQFMS